MAPRRYAARGPRRSRLAVDGRQWRALERETAEESEGWDSPGPNAPDGTSFGQVFSRECKATTAASIVLKLDWLEKLAAEAGAAGRAPLLVVGFEARLEKSASRWACVPFGLFCAMARAWIKEGGHAG